jgi:integrase
MSWIYKRNDSDRWWIGYRQNGVQVLSSTGQTSEEEAKKFQAKIDAMLAAQRAGALTVELFQEISGKKLPTMTVHAAMADWLTEAAGATGKRTLEKYQSFADAFKKHFHVTEHGPLVADLTREQLQELLTQKRATVSAGTANMMRKCMAIFFKRCKSIGAIRDNPVESIKTFKATRDEKRKRRPFTVKELGSLYEQAPDDFWRYMVLAGFFTGLRLGDLVTMPIGAVDYKARTINIMTQKTGATLHIPIAKPLYKMLVTMRDERKGAAPTDYFWPVQAERYHKSGSGWFSQRFYDLLLLKAGLVKSRPHRKGTKSHSDKRKVNEVSFHCFRHSNVSTLAALGHNQQIVKALVGHSSDEINDLYTKVPAGVLKDAVALLPDITKPQNGGRA